MVGGPLAKAETVLSTGMHLEFVGHTVCLQGGGKIGYYEILYVGIMLGEAQIEFALDLVRQPVR
jgi:hypothetical protein